MSLHELVLVHLSSRLSPFSIDRVGLLLNVSAAAATASAAAAVGGEYLLTLLASRLVSCLVLNEETIQLGRVKG